MKKKLKILYIQPYEFYGLQAFLITFIRISNYLKSRETEIKGTISERYFDLRYEDLPDYIPENISIYRNRLKDKLENLYNEFDFNIVAISCFTSFNYINTVEVACLIKKYINPKCNIVVGGVHPTVYPDDFMEINNFPIFLRNHYNPKENPFDFLVEDEGEIPFFFLIKDILNGNLEEKYGKLTKCLILEKQIIQNLNDLPLLDLSLYEPYREKIIKINNFYIDFVRGCPFQCLTCPSKDDIKSYKCIRSKSISKCIQELDIIRNTFPVNNIVIVDMVFFPKKIERMNFFRQLESYKMENKQDFKIHINDRIEVCSLEDLEKYKKLSITPNFGFESGSITWLEKLGKVSSKLAAEHYLEKFESLVNYGNELNLFMIFFYLIGAPGSNIETFKESYDYLYNPHDDKLSIIQTYQINFFLAKYIAYPGSPLYRLSETKFGAKIYFKEWWKIFAKDQVYYGGYVDPNRDFSLINCLERNRELYKIIVKHQFKLRNKFYFPLIFGKKKVIEIFKALDVNEVVI